MDRVGARNTFIVLIATVFLTVASFGVLLTMVYNGKDVPDLLIGITTTLLGILTGSTVSLSAKPSVTKGTPADPVSTQEVADDTVPALETDVADHLDGPGAPRPLDPASL